MIIIGISERLGIRDDDAWAKWKLFDVRLDAVTFVSVTVSCRS
jgi:hypothetical protein